MLWRNKRRDGNGLLGATSCGGGGSCCRCCSSRGSRRRRGCLMIETRIWSRRGHGGRGIHDGWTSCVARVERRRTVRTRRRGWTRQVKGRMRRNCGSYSAGVGLARRRGAAGITLERVGVVREAVRLRRTCWTRGPHLAEEKGQRRRRRRQRQRERAAVLCLLLLTFVVIKAASTIEQQAVRGCTNLGRGRPDKQHQSLAANKRPLLLGFPYDSQT